MNRAEAEQIVIALRESGLPVEYLLAPDEGHGFARPVAMFMAAERFLAAQIGGRQEGGSAEVIQRLKVITVDPTTVGLAKTAERTVSSTKPEY